MSPPRKASTRRRRTPRYPSLTSPHTGAYRIRWTHFAIGSLSIHGLVIAAIFWVAPLFGPRKGPGVEGLSNIIMIAATDIGEGDGTVGTQHAADILSNGASGSPTSVPKKKSGPMAHHISPQPISRTKTADASSESIVIPREGPEQPGMGNNNRESQNNGGAVGGGSNVLATIRRQIEHAKLYPMALRQEGIEGRPEVEFQISEDGTVRFVHVVSPSGDRRLDDAAIMTVQHAAPFPFYPGPIRLAIRFFLQP